MLLLNSIKHHLPASRIVTAGMLAAAMLVHAGTTRASIQLDSSTVMQDHSTIIAWSHTVAPGLDRILIVGVSIFSANKSVLSLTYGTADLTFVGAQNGGSGSNNRRMEIWYILGPPPGTADITVTMSTGSKVVAGAASFFGVDPQLPLGTFVSAQDHSTDPSVTVASAAGALIVDCIATKGAALSIAPSADQAELWNDVTRTNGGNIMGGASIKPGGATTTMVWSLGKSEYWVLGAVPLLPAPPRPYLPDAMVKRLAEPDAAYLSDSVYEALATLQVKRDAINSGTTIDYAIRFENDGLHPDSLVITGTAATADFDVRYIDESGSDVTAAVTSGGYLGRALPPGAATVWTVTVSPLPTAPGGTALDLFVTATSSGDPAAIDQVGVSTSSSSPRLTLSKSTDAGDVMPGQDVAYTIVASSMSGLGDARNIVVVDSIPEYTGYRVGSATFDPGTTLLTSTISYSNDNGATWTYAPAAGSCAAPSGYDYCVTHVRWTLAGFMPADRTFTLGFAARVK